MDFRPNVRVNFMKISRLVMGGLVTGFEELILDNGIWILQLYNFPENFLCLNTSFAEYKP